MHENMFVADTIGLNFLCTQGFTVDQAVRLVEMRENFAQQLEYRERTAEQNRLNFVRWLFEHGKISQ
jgi:hypothetical protein